MWYEQKLMNRKQIHFEVIKETIFTIRLAKTAFTAIIPIRK